MDAVHRDLTWDFDRDAIHRHLTWDFDKAAIHRDLIWDFDRDETKGIQHGILSGFKMQQSNAINIGKVALY